MATDPWDGTGAAKAAETSEEIVRILAVLARRSRREGLVCASEALDQAVIAVFNALSVDRQTDALPRSERPSQPGVGWH